MPARSIEKLRAENDELRLRLEEAEQALEAIRTGQVDSLVVEGPNGVQVFSLDSAIQSHRVLVEAMSEGAATLSDEGTILYCNGRFATLVGAPLERVMGTPIDAWIGERHRGTLASMLLGAVDGDVREELGVVHAGGEEVPAYVSISAMQDEGRRMFCLVFTDLREQKRNEEIVASERLARSVLEQSAEAIVVCDREGRVVRASQAAETLGGRSPLFLPFDEAFPVALVGHRARAAPTQVAAAVLRGETLRAASATIRRSNGPALDVLVSATALRAGSGDVIGCVVTLVDVTDHRRREEALRRSEERYRTASESLREADRRKNEFLAVLSHELRNPLAPILNSLYILDRAPAGSEQARRAQAIVRRQAEQLTRLVDDLLDVTRIARNKIELKRERLDLNDVVRRTVEDYRSLFEASGVVLETSFAPQPVFLHADGPRIAQVVGNLLQNAAKFTGRGGTTSVSVLRDDAEKRAVIRVADSGIGMLPETVERLFEPFMQADATLDRSRGGLGLGLALVKSLVELHGGDVTARSRGVGQGAEFVVRLPLESAPQSAPRRHAAASRRPRKVLVVEDNADSASSLREALELGGHEVVVAYDGNEGVAKARQFRPEVVLCDIGLPGMDGYDLARKLRAEESLVGAFLVALSGYALPQDVERAADAGFERHLVKPVSLDQLEEVLAAVPARAARGAV